MGSPGTVQCRALDVADRLRIGIAGIGRADGLRLPLDAGRIVTRLVGPIVVDGDASDEGIDAIAIRDGFS